MSNELARPGTVSRGIPVSGMVSGMDEELRSLTERLHDESGGSAEYLRLTATGDREALAAVVTAAGQPL